MRKCIPPKSGVFDGKRYKKYRKDKKGESEEDRDMQTMQIKKFHRMEIEEKINDLWGNRTTLFLHVQDRYLLEDKCAPVLDGRIDVLKG